jgi:hypothetical protein
LQRLQANGPQQEAHGLFDLLHVTLHPAHKAGEARDPQPWQTKNAALFAEDGVF